MISDQIALHSVQLLLFILEEGKFSFTLLMFSSLALTGASNPIQFESARKIWIYSNCSQKLDDCSLDRARNFFAIARMLGFSLKFPAV